MGPITIEAIIGDGALYHPDRECAPEASWPCEAHGNWACGMKARPGEDCPGIDFGVVYSHEDLDGSECCDRCMMPLDQAAFDFWQEQEVEKDHKSGGHKRARELGLSRDAVDCPLCDEEDENAEETPEELHRTGNCDDDCELCAVAGADDAPEYADSCAICHADSCSC